MSQLSKLAVAAIVGGTAGYGYHLLMDVCGTG